MNITLKSFYKFCKKYPSIKKEFEKGTIKVLTHSGYAPIKGIQQINSESNLVRIKTENGLSLICSKKHLFPLNTDQEITINVPASKIKVGDSLIVQKNINGLEKFESARVIEIETVEQLNSNSKHLYDLQVENSLYFTNGILSHNSTIMSAMTYALYGKSGSKKNISDLPNRINKSLETEIQIQSDTKQLEQITIHRGAAPSIFNVYIGSNYTLDVAGKKNIQDILEKEYYGIPYYIFNNIISLSVNDFKSFLTMTPNDKRIIIDKILGLEIINKMLEFNRADVKLKKDRQLTISAESRIAKNSFEASIESKKNAQKQQSELSADRIQEIDNYLKDLEKNLEKLNANYSVVLDKKNKLCEKNLEIERLLAQHESQQKNIKSKKKLFEKDICPTCGSPLNSEFHQHLHVQIKQEYELNEKKINEIVEKRLKINEALQKITSALQKVNVDIQKIQVDINVYERQKDELNNVKSFDTSAIDEVIDSLRLKLNNLEQELEDIEISIAIHNIVQLVLGENGIRQKIIKSTIPTLNRTIQYYLTEMSMPFNVLFDENFNAILHDENNHQITIDTLSTGEMKKIDFAVLLSVISVFKIKYPNLNIIFLDEIFSSVDEEGRNNIIKILKDFSEQYSMHVFIINHTEMPIEMFSSVIEVKKNHGFSKLQQNYNESVRFEHNS